MDKPVLNYSLAEQDYLHFMLFFASRSKRIRKSRIISWVTIPLLNVLLIVYAAVNSIYTIVWSLAILSAIWVVFYPFYSAYRYKKYYLNNIRDHYKNRIGVAFEISFDEQCFYMKDGVSESKLQISEIVEIIEIMDCFFIKNKQDLSVVVPKTVDGSDEFIKRLESLLKIERTDATGWKWR